MGVKEHKPTSAGRRFASVCDFKEITKTHPERRLTEPMRKTGGRNNVGRLSVRHIGGGVKRRYRIIDFRRQKDDIPAVVEAIEYDPNRSPRIALLKYKDGERRYILCPEGLNVGDEVVSGEKVEPRVGCAMPLKSIPTGMMVHNLELTPGRGGQLARSAGTFAQLQAKEGNYADVLLPSGEVRKIHVRCRATIGQLGNIEWANIVLGKAGRKRWLGVRPTVRGKAMNPVSHPLGGGDGRGGSGRHPVNWKGTKYAKGGKTRRSKKPSDSFIVRMRKAGTHQNTRK
ncbi:MAG: 50S ribosomal protein L2 [Planctomycetes bacterium]|nr:50S ribosomal protein L2 [Planctomycetota bacterium]